MTASDRDHLGTLRAIMSEWLRAIIGIRTLWWNDMNLAISHSAIVTRADALVGAGRPEDAYALLQQGAAAANPHASFALGLWRLSGQLIKRDLTASRSWFEVAAHGGHEEAARIYTNFVANGTGEAADWRQAFELLRSMRSRDIWAAEQLSIIENMSIDGDGEPTWFPDPEELSEHPYIRCFRGLFSHAECDFLTRLAEPHFSPSVVIDSRTGTTIRDPIRTSDGTFFPFVKESPAIHALNRRLAAITQSDVRNGEPLQILRYFPGQEYKRHVDALTDERNQRVLTALVYLNDGFTGGETYFNRVALRFKGGLGDALVFRNSLISGEADQMSQHAGLPVVSGSKLLASRWIRGAQFSVAPPRPVLAI